MTRKIITIDENLCNGCGLCVSACHEGALQLVDGKAKLLSDSYCDGLGACLPECPTGAIKIVERDAAPFDAAAVAAKQAAEHRTPNAEVTAAHAPNTGGTPVPPLACGCPGKMAKTITRAATSEFDVQRSAFDVPSSLTNWPVQIKLVPVSAPYLKNAALLIAADCTAFAYPDIHRRFMTNKVTLIGCPKLDEGDYAEKLTALLEANDIRSVTVLRMEVPCCAGIANAAKQALLASGKMIPWHVVTISTDGVILDE
jgi:ferredoxin